MPPHLTPAIKVNQKGSCTGRLRFCLLANNPRNSPCVRPNPQAKPDAARAPPFADKRIQRLMHDTSDLQSWLAQRQAALEMAAAPIEGAVTVQEIAAPQTLVLDDRHRSVLRELFRRATWTLAELRTLTSRFGLMPLACISKLNDWVQDNYGDRIAEGEDIVTINLHLKAKLEI